MCPYFSVDDATLTVAVGSSRTEVAELDSASGDSAHFHRLCIALPGLHHCFPVDLDMVEVLLQPTKKTRF